MKSQQEKRGNDGKFKKGFSGNPDGRPIGAISIVSIIKEKLADIPDGQKHSFAEIIVKKILHMCLNGDTSMIKDLINRVDGMPVQRNEDTGKDGEPIQHEVTIKLVSSK